ncbi:MAG: acetyl/propionyl/methylcrotonyl-CoA carboxylase subunit alpha [Polaromonas sp.]|nr:acetyl/propionyl/methylcrotonyl-CoA carboxylase subunit alpha [Polaromonas sp.]
MFKKILIANRGEIACRVAATAKRMAIKTVAVYSDADASAKHVEACDQAVYIGGSAPKDSYLRWEKIIAAAKATGAQAIHPGYGFLSENEEFAQACADAGLVFIGPPPSAIRAMGLKAESKKLMEKAGVPVVPGYHGSDQSPAVLRREADRIGYPVLIKASAGGGGKGMRAVDRSEDFEAALQSCQREAITSFGNDVVLIEKYARRPRHIEIQVFGDSHGNCVYLFERDCSVQRRHQKVLEEAPAPGMTHAMRQQMGEAAVAAARAVNYVGAGTVEFIVEQHEQHELGDTEGPPQGGAPPSAGSEPREAGSVGDFYFMEMNTRLQVEHPVTEAITGLDLVEWQLRVAAGERLPLAQDQLHMHGHAIEARICAENPDNQFLPATGTLCIYQKPEHTTFETGATRIDDGVRQGDTISPFYDSMVAKLIVHGRTREEALARLDGALAQIRIVGLTTNVQFLRYVVRSESFANANLDTALVERERLALFHQEPVGLVRAAAAVIAHTLLAEGALAGNDPFSRRDGWQAYGQQRRCFALEFHGDAVMAELVYGPSGALRLTVAEKEGSLNFAATRAGVAVAFAGERFTAKIESNQGVVHVFTDEGATEIKVIDRLAAAASAGHESASGRLAAPMPGKVVSFAVQAGDRITKGQPLAVMDAMKMEHTIAAPTDGVVLELLFAPGDQVAEGEELLKIGGVEAFPVTLPVA